MSLEVSGGLYHLQVTGVGKPGRDGYPDYGSLGQYTLTGVVNSPSDDPLADDGHMGCYLRKPTFG